MRTKDKGAVRLKDGTTGETNSETHAHTQAYTTESSGQLFASCASPCERDDLQTAARLSHSGVFV